MPDAVFVNPQCEWPNEPNLRPPLGPLCIAAVLVEKGYSIEIIDETVEENARERLRQYLAEGTGFVGISSLTGQMIRGGLDVARFVRDVAPHVPIVWGGVHTTSDPEGTLRHPLVDIICIGEGEPVVPALIDAVYGKRKMDEVPGIGFKRDGRPVFTPAPTPIDLDTLPPLPYHLIDMEYYRQQAGKPEPFFGFDSSFVLSLETSRGCAFRCTYCIQSIVPQKYRFMSAEAVVRHLSDIVEQGCRSVTIVDDNFFVRIKRARVVLDEIRKQNWNLEIFVAVRSDTITRMTDEDFERVKESGIKLFGIGVESGSNRMLEILEKRETIETTFTASKLLRKWRIHAWYHFIVGYPGETLKDIMDSYKAMERIIRTNRFARISNKKLILLPNSKVYQDAVAGGFRPRNSLEDWIDIADLGWFGKAPYVAPEAETFFQNTRYFFRAVDYVSAMRVSWYRPVSPFFDFIYYIYFRLACLSLRIRIFFGAHEYWWDNRVLKPVFWTVVKIARALKLPEW